MAYVHPSVTATVAGRPIHAMLAQFPNVCFTLTLLTDILYWRTSHLMWQEFSSWLLLFGLVVGGLALVAGLVDFLSRRAVRTPAPAWPHALGGAAVLALAFLNALIHAGDGWTAVVPWGLVLSAVTVVVMIATEWTGRALVFVHAVGVNRHE